MIHQDVNTHTFPKREVLNVHFHEITVCQLIEYIIESASLPVKSIVGNLNVRAANFAYELPWYRDFIRSCSLVFCDGFGILLAAKLNGYELNSDHRMTCPDYIEDLAKSCEKAGLSLFLLAGRPGITEKAISKLTAIAPNLKIDGHHGFFEKTGPENDVVIEKINQFSPAILYVGFGMPLQERWIIDNFDKVDTHVFLPLGACLDFYTDTVKRGPKFLTDNGFEWLTRFLTEPRRLWSRYFIGNTLFFYRALKESRIS